MKYLAKGLLFLLQFAILIGAGYIALELSMQAMVHSRKEVLVTDLKGQTIYQAIDSLSQINLAIAKESEEYAPEIPAGLIIKQYPLAGAKVREGHIVHVAISLGSEKIAVSDLTEMPIRRAEIELKLAQLLLGEVEERYSLKADRGHILGQDPKPFSLAEKGDMVHVTISLGSPPRGKFLVPDFTQKPVEEAIEWSKENSISFTIEEQEDPSMHGLVISQSLPADTILSRRRLKRSNPIVALVIGKRIIEEVKSQRTYEYRLPARPQRTRQMRIAILTSSGEKEIFKGDVSPSEKLSVPIPNSLGAGALRARIYLDGVLTEEETIE
ncbi:PASTA domain-containing protein [Elusimicrobiota bacterium]